MLTRLKYIRYKYRSLQPSDKVIRMESAAHHESADAIHILLSASVVELEAPKLASF